MLARTLGHGQRRSLGILQVMGASSGATWSWRDSGTTISVSRSVTEVEQDAKLAQEWDELELVVNTCSLRQENWDMPGVSGRIAQALYLLESFILILAVVSI